MRCVPSPLVTVAMLVSTAVFAEASPPPVHTGAREREGDDAKEVAAILDKAIKAIGGEERLSKIKAGTWKSKGTGKLGREDSRYVEEITFKGTTHLRDRLDITVGDRTTNTVIVYAGDEGWSKNGPKVVELPAISLPMVHARLVPVLILPLKGKEYKVEKVADKTAVALKVTPPKGDPFVLYFNMQSGLPEKMVTQVPRKAGDGPKIVTTFADYKVMSGIMVATKRTIRYRDMVQGEYDVTDFKILNKVDPTTFSKPE